MKILVLGATGYVGGHLVPELLRAGHRVRCMVRDRSRLRTPGPDVVQGDVLDAGAVDAAVAGCDRIVYLVHSMRSTEGSFEDLDQRAAGNVAAAARKHDVDKIVYLGGLGHRGAAQTPHLRSRHEVARTLRSGGVPVFEFRAAVVIGAGSASFEMIRALVTRLPVMICPKWVRVKTQPIAVVDAVRYLREAVCRPEAIDMTVDIGGPDVLSYRAMMLTVARQLGLRRWIIPVPVLTPWLSSHWVNLVTSVSAPLARALIESVRSETVCEDDRALRLFDFAPIGFEAAVRRALEVDTNGLR